MLTNGRFSEGAVVNDVYATNLRDQKGEPCQANRQDPARKKAMDSVVMVMQ
jgi:hypothetical protein